MPVCERDPWRFQFFDQVECPDDVLIPTDDPDSWLWYPRHRWVYDKLKVAQSQGIACGPHGVLPEKFPVFSKPIMNLKGMGIGSRIIENPVAFDHFYEPGHMWMELLTGDHVSTDCAVENGRAKWIRHATGVAWKDGMFKYWTVHATPKLSLEVYLSEDMEALGDLLAEVRTELRSRGLRIAAEAWQRAIDARLRALLAQRRVDEAKSLLLGRLLPAEVRTFEVRPLPQALEPS